MKPLVPILLVLTLVWRLAAQTPATVAEDPAQQRFATALGRVVALFNPGTNATALVTTLELVEAQGLPKELLGQKLGLTFQAPDHFKLSGSVSQEEFQLGRDGQELWIWEPAKSFGLIGAPGVKKYATRADSLDTSRLDPITLPLPPQQLALLPFVFKSQSLPDAEVEGVKCHVIRTAPLAEARAALQLPDLTLTLWLRESDSLPVRIGYVGADGVRATVALHQLRIGQALPAAQWKIPAPAGAKVERVALSHLKKFFPAAFEVLTTRVEPLGPATGERRLIATHGQGRLEMHDGTRVLFLKGTPEEMGEQHGTLLRPEVRDLVNRVVYGVGVGSSFEKGRWFFGEVEECQARISKFVDLRYTREMDSLALAAKLDPEEMRLANFFPELFHCSGFCVLGSTVKDGHMYHGRILDYMRGVGLENNAAVVVFQPDQGNAWVDISYAGFVGSVTAMNAKHISMGEMGGRGEGKWDGKPMAQLIREVMEKASTLDEAVAIMRDAPRTCEYYYVISDGNAHTAVGIAATPTTFEVIHTGEAHPRLPHAIKDAVLMSAGDRYEELAKRVQARTRIGQFDADSARDLMTRPVCMTSNIHSVLFEPDTLDFWVANADSANPASHTRYTHYNLGELLTSEPPKQQAKAK
jgi:outer membrane lipoprotein-sorting protein